MPLFEAPFITGTWSMSWSMNWPIVIRRAQNREDGLGAVPTMLFETVRADGKLPLGKNSPSCEYKVGYVISILLTIHEMHIKM